MLYLIVDVTNVESGNTNTEDDEASHQPDGQDE